jgi:transcriptional antiterminator RfaH
MSQIVESNICFPQWYAVWTRSRQEKVSASMLEALNIPTFLPLRTDVRQWSDRKQTVTVPLFTGYLFVCINLAHGNHRLDVLKVPGVVGFVGNSSGPLAIPGQQIENIRTLLDSGIDYEVGSLLKEGDRIKVIHGSLSGMEGTLVRTNSGTRLVIAVDLVKRSLRIDVSRQDVVLIDDLAA